MCLKSCIWVGVLFGVGEAAGVGTDTAGGGANDADDEIKKQFPNTPS